MAQATATATDGGTQAVPVAEAPAAGTSVRVGHIQTRPNLPEEQLILRVPPSLAPKVAQLLEKGLESRLSFTWEDERNGFMSMDGQEYPFKLHDLPCIIESHKTLDKKNFVKIADVSQMVVVYLNQHDANAATIVLEDGITPPTKDIRKRRFRHKNPGDPIQLPELEQKLFDLVNGADILSLDIVPDPGDDVEDGIFVDTVAGGEYSDEDDEHATDDSSGSEDSEGEGDEDEEDDEGGDETKVGEEDDDDDGSLSDVDDLMQELEAELDDDQDEDEQTQGDNNEEEEEEEAIQIDGDDDDDDDDTTAAGAAAAMDLTQDDGDSVSVPAAATAAVSQPAAGDGTASGDHAELGQVIAQLDDKRSMHARVSANLATQEREASQAGNVILKQRFTSKAESLRTELVQIQNEIATLEERLKTIQTSGSTSQASVSVPTAPATEPEPMEEEEVEVFADDITAFQGGYDD